MIGAADASPRPPRDGGALRRQLRDVATVAGLASSAQLVDEFWVPPAGERADLVGIGTELWGFEIKSARDDLRRLPRQVAAFSRVFDRCVAVVATRHRGDADALLPIWWGVIEACDDGQLVWCRQPDQNTSIDPEVLVRLLWRQEAAALLRELDVPVTRSSRRHVMWRRLVCELDAPELAERVRHTLLARDPAAARIPSHRFVSAQPAVG